jgi:hypothetical protein
MGVLKSLAIQRDAARPFAEDIAIAAGLGTKCASHPGVFMSEFSDEGLLVQAYKIANARITSGELTLPSMMDRKDFVELIKDVVNQAPDFCPECHRQADE